MTHPRERSEIEMEEWRDRIAAATTLDELKAVEQSAVRGSFTRDQGRALHDAYAARWHELSADG